MSSVDFKQQLSRIQTEYDQLNKHAENYKTKEIQDRVSELSNSIKSLQLKMSETTRTDSRELQCVNDLSDSIHNLVSKVFHEQIPFSASSGASSSETPPAAEKSFTPLREKSAVNYRTISPKLGQIICLNQHITQGGNVACGFHSLKNALCALELSKNSSTASDKNIFEDQTVYEHIEGIVCSLRGANEQGDATITELRAAWNALVNKSVHPFPDTTEPMHFDNKDLSFFHLEKNGLVTADPESIVALENLKELSEKQGPCHHAFVIGGEGHWITIIYEKNEANQISWYGVDSEHNKQDQFQDSINWITHAMENLNTTSLKSYYNSIGQNLDMKSQLIRPDNQLVDSNDQSLFADADQKAILLPDLKTAVKFMKSMGWLDQPHGNPLVGDFISRVKVIFDFYKSLDDPEINEMASQLAKITFTPKTLDPYEKQIAILELNIPDTVKAKSKLTTLINMAEFSPPVKLQILNVINSQSEEDRFKYLEDILLLVNKGYTPLLEKVFIPDNRVQSEDNLKLVTDLMTLNVLPLPTKDPAIIQSFTDQIDFTATRNAQKEALHVWLLAHPIMREDIIPILTSKLFQISDYKIVNTLATLTKDYITIFKPADEDTFDEKYEHLRYFFNRGIELTTEQARRHDRNPYTFHEILEETRRGQVPRKLLFEDQGNYYYLLQQPFKEKEIYSKNDLPPGLNKNTLRGLFEGIDQRLQSNPELATAILQALKEVGYISYEGTVQMGINEFNKLKVNFLSDATIASYLNIPEGDDSSIKKETFYFYKLLENWMDLSTERSNENALSPQEEVLLKNSAIIEGCGTGKREKVCGIYRSDPSLRLEPVSPSEKPEPSASLSALEEDLHERIHTFLGTGTLYEKYGTLIENIFNNESFIEKLCGVTSLSEPPHQITYVKNRFGKLVGLPENQTFDWYNSVIMRSLLDVTEEKFWSVFLGFAKDFIKEIPKTLSVDKLMTQINQTLTENNALLLQNFKYNTGSEIPDEQKLSGKGIYDTITKSTTTVKDENGEVVELTNYHLPNLFEDLKALIASVSGVKPDDVNVVKNFELGGEWEDQIVGIKEETLMLLMEGLSIMTKKSSILKIDPSKETSLQDIFSMIQENKPFKTLDLSHCTWLTIMDINTIISRCGSLTSLNLSGCTQFSDEEMSQILNECDLIENLDLSGCTQLKNLKTKTKIPHLIAEGCGMITRTVRLTGDLEIAIPLNESTEELTQRVLDQYPDQIGFYLYSLGFTLDQAIQFYTERQLISIDLTYYMYKTNHNHIIKLVENNPNVQKITIYSDTVNDGSIQFIAENCKNLTSLNLKGCYNITEVAVKFLAENCKNLTSLDLHNCFRTTDTAIISLAKNCKNLTSLDLSNCGQITDAAIIALAKNCKNLTSLNLEACYITDAAVVILAENCKNLTSLNLANCGRITDAVIKSLTENCKELTSLNLSHCSRITDAAIKSLTENCKELTSLNLNSCSWMTDSAIISLAKNCKNLTSLNLVGCNKITNAAIIALAENCKELKSLDLEGCFNITDEAIISLANNCKHLTSLALTYCSDITDVAVETLIENCKRLTLLQLYNCTHVTVAMRNSLRQRGIRTN